MTTPALDALRALLPLLAARDEDRAVTGAFGGDTLNAIEAALALIEASANSRNGEESMACKSDDDHSDEALWAGVAAGMITPAHIAPPCKALPPPNDLEASIRDTIAHFIGGDDLAKDAADAVLEIVRPLAERSDRLECALREVKEAVEFTPLGVRGIKALQAARAALEELK